MPLMRYAAVVLLSLLPLLANALEQGDKLAPFTLLDQYDPCLLYTSPSPRD